MKNVKMAVKDNVLTITVDLKKDHGESKSGKNTIIATTEGNAEVPGAAGTKIGLNIYRPVDEK